MTVALLPMSGSIAAVSAAQSTPPQTPQALFKSGIDLVRISAVVRDRKGRFVQDLSARDFEVLDGGQARPITDFRTDASGVSVAVLFDVSGSMQGALPSAREAAEHLLAWLEPRDEAAIFTFDTRLREMTPFTAGLRALPAELSAVVPFGATSLRDAIASTAERAGTREGRRRAVVVLTDGADNASRMRAGDVSSAASAIDVPVYVFGVVPAVDDPAADTRAIGADKSPLAGDLADLAFHTGGDIVVASTTAGRSVAARRIIDELRHQYLLAFEPSHAPGWHPIVVRARDKDLVVRARSGYLTGQIHSSDSNQEESSCVRCS